jgi:hypothetical protein
MRQRVLDDEPWAPPDLEASWEQWAERVGIYELLKNQIKLSVRL